MSVTGTPPIVANVRVGGRDLDAPVAPVINPASFDETVGYVALGDDGHVELAVSAAERAGIGWRAAGFPSRAAMLHRAAQAVRMDVEWLARVLTVEQGKTLEESRADVAGAANVLEYYASLPSSTFEDEPFDRKANGQIWMGRRPMGVTAVIVPWNSPVYLAFLSLAPALVSGNTVIVKPSEYAPLALAEVLRIVERDLPVGVINTVPGRAEPGAAMACHPRIRKLMFTGSTATGKSIMRAGAGNLKNLSLELGGNDPAIVLESATLDDRLFRELRVGALALSGQVCFSVKRIYVHRSLYEEFVAGFAECVDEVVVGDGLDAGVMMGPVNNSNQFQRVQTLISDAAASGATVTELGRRSDPSGWTGGYFLQPTVVTNVSDQAAIVAEEQFGPAIPVLPYDDEEDVVARVNRSEFGLAASLWTRDLAHARELAPKLESGTVFVNVHRGGASDVAMPFGGFKQSGVGRLHGLAAIRACTETQMIAVHEDASHLAPAGLGSGGAVNGTPTTSRFTEVPDQESSTMRTEGSQEIAS